MLGIVLIDKPQGLTSHDAVSRLRRIFQTRRIGHAGTLDPLATGLLVMAVGPATRFLQYLDLEPKEYVTDFRFGIETDSYDAEGEVVAEKPVPDNLEARILAAVPDFVGSISQLPPMYSAVKKDGKPLYDYARKGIDVERKPREVYIEEYEVVSVNEGLVSVRIVCSGGTYVRTLAHDLGQAVGCGAHVESLRRTQVGRFHLDDATTIENVGPDHLIPLNIALDDLPSMQLSDIRTTYARQGRPLRPDKMDTGNLEQGSPVCLLGPDGSVVAMARYDGELLQPECVLPGDATDEAV